jgi:hypothetical protein
VEVTYLLPLNNLIQVQHLQSFPTGSLLILDVARISLQLMQRLHYRMTKVTKMAMVSNTNIGSKLLVCIDNISVPGNLVQHALRSILVILDYI